MTVPSLLSSMLMDEGGGSKDNDSWIDRPGNPLPGMALSVVCSERKVRAVTDAASDFLVCHFADRYCCAAWTVSFSHFCHSENEMVAVLYGAGAIAGYVSEDFSGVLVC